MFSGFLFSGGIQRDLWHEIGLVLIMVTLKQTNKKMYCNSLEIFFLLQHIMVKFLITYEYIRPSG